MKPGVWHLMMMCVLGSGIVASIPLPCHASHYRLTRSLNLLSESERRSMDDAQIKTTQDLLEASAKVKDRRHLSKTTGLSFARLTELATQCDLLRISGVGPKAVRLLQAAGIRHSTHMRQADAEAIYEKIKSINQNHRLTEVIPQVKELSSWIRQARSIPKLLEGVR
jgi:predicted flap endonuclease-1-like 5' DNA nuclease